MQVVDVDGGVAPAVGVGDFKDALLAQVVVGTGGRAPALPVKPAHTPTTTDVGEFLRGAAGACGVDGGAFLPRASMGSGALMLWLYCTVALKPTG